MNLSYQKSKDTELPQLLTLKQAAECLSVCRRTVERLISAGALHALKVAGSTRVEVAELVRYVDRQRGNSEGGNA